jgi:multiple sugar transport system permease protein
VSPPPSRALLSAVPWLAGVLVLIVGVVLFPAGYMVWNATRNISTSGVDRGGAGLENFERVAALAALPRVLLNSAVWVIGVVLLTVLISLGLAQFLNKAFPGRRWVRLAVIVPWAASVVMTSTVFYYGIINRALVDVGLLDAPFGFTKQPVPAFAVAMGVAVFVSLPFTTYTLLAGLQTIPDDVLEAARIDGADRFASYRLVVLPMLRPAIAVATLINIINVFNSLPILRIIAGSIPGYDADTTTTLIFKLIQTERQIDTASALSVVNFGLVVVITVIYVRIARPMQED